MARSGCSANLLKRRIKIVAAIIGIGSQLKGFIAIAGIGNTVSQNIADKTRGGISISRVGRCFSDVQKFVDFYYDGIRLNCYRPRRRATGRRCDIFDVGTGKRPCRLSRMRDRKKQSA